MAIPGLNFRRMFTESFGNGFQQAAATSFTASSTQQGIPPTNPLKDRIVASAAVQQEMPDAFQWAEIQRIVNLPIMHGMTPAEFEIFCKERIRGEYFDKGFRFLPAQASTILAYELFNGAWGKVPVGRGKTLISLAVAKAAFTKGLQKILLFVPPEVLSQLVDTDIPGHGHVSVLTIPFTFSAA